ncbi:MAG: class III poly(R)-hydroxyalkanoic acid synthase subunit PhaC [Candidatus Methanoperedens sp.]|nr:class III poly(R)-hydroxyalkanoic acid synthase subunit PhaC [Candidatus Methanoperedens sp. BLZ2]MBZ0174485.1 class III poly(R)-hydroxyalkanoic acid synthase subunit PhaC [Candidatus Methanoperedens nitroreducens]MCX9078508.1 class III poly(R)-hydroxyalkanoic acid synthase subunit PhaC [Candidatus Methanoperedens sp.]
MIQTMNGLNLIEEPFIKFTKSCEVISELTEISVGTTPHEIVYSEDKMKLFHYKPAVENPCQVPVLMIYALVNRYYILDLSPDKSVIKNLLDKGFDVYAIDWGYPSGMDKYLTIDDYVNGYLNNAVDYVRRESGADKISLLGVCVGGTLSAMYASLHPEKVKNLISFVAPINFDTDKSLLNIWAKEMDVDKIVDYYGIVPGDFLNMGFLLLDPFRLMIDKYVGFLERIDDKKTVENFLRMEKWIFDSPGQAGEAYRQFMKDCYQKNLLIKNKMEIGGKRINLKKISMPLLNIMAQFDHLVPNESSQPLTEAVSSTDKESMVFPTGHIGMFVGSKSQNEVCPKIAQWLKPRSITSKDETPKSTDADRDQNKTDVKKSKSKKSNRKSKEIKK